MLESTPAQAKEPDFEKNLIDRFFHSKSYFLNCFLARLRELEGGNLDPLHVVTVGLAMDEMANAEDKSSLLVKLDQIPVFRRYHEQLQQGIEFLQTSHLSTQQMMEIVNSLGRSLADAMAEVMENEPSRESLLKQLELKATEQVPVSEASSNPTPSAVRETFQVAKRSDTDKEAPKLKLEWHSGLESTGEGEMPELKLESGPETESSKVEEIPQQESDLAAEIEAVVEPDIPKLNLDELPELDSEIPRLDLDTQPEVVITETELSDDELDLLPEVELPTEVDSEISALAGNEIPKLKLSDPPGLESSPADLTDFTAPSSHSLEDEPAPGQNSATPASEELGIEDVLQELEMIREESHPNQPDEQSSVDLWHAQDDQILSGKIRDGEAETEEVQPWSHFKDDVDEKLQTLKSHLDAFAADPENWRYFRRIKNDFRDLRDWAMIQGDEGIEAMSHKTLLLIETVHLRGSENRFAIYSTLKNTFDALHEINEAGRGSERLDIVRIMVNQIDKQKRIYPRSLTDSKSPAAGHFVAAPEQPSIAAEVPKPEPEEETTLDQAVFSPISQTPEHDTVADEIEQPPEVEEVFQFQEQEGAGEDRGPVPASDPADFGSIRESELLSELLDEQVESGKAIEEQDFLADTEDGQQAADVAGLETSQLQPTSSKAAGPSDLTPSDAPQSGEDQERSWEIPGEEDQDLMDILSDIKQEVDLANTPVMKNETAPDIIEDSDAKKNPVLATEQEASSEKSVAAGGDSGRQSQTESPRGAGKLAENGNGFDYVTEADMYFTFSRKALQELMRNPAKSQSMEDSELAFYSLKVLAERLDYPVVNRIMACAERLIQKKLGSRDTLSTVQVNSLYTVITEIEQGCRDKKLNEPSRQAWLKQQLAVFKKWTGSKTGDTMKIETFASAKADKMKAEDDPMDFLLFDDTSNFFKQLLKE